MDTMDIEISTHVDRDDLEMDALAAAHRRQTRRRRIVGFACAGVLLVVAVVATVLVILSLSKTASSGVSVPDHFKSSFSIRSAGKDQGNPNVAPTTGILYKKTNPDGTWTVSVDMAQESNGMKTRVVYLDKRAYVTVTDLSTNTVVNSDCVEDDQVPPVEDLVASFDSASELSSHDDVVDHVEEDCKDREKFVISWSGLTYIFCSPQSSNVQDQIVGEEFAADLFDIVTNPDSNPVTRPVNEQGNTFECPIVDRQPGSHARRLKELGQAEDEAEEETAPWYLQSSAEAHAEHRRLSSKACVFMHGLGRDTTSGPTTTDTEYWGNVHKYAKCGSYKFLHRDTVNVDWTNAALQQYVCDQTATNGVIQNTIVFTHSMGTLILGGAIANGRCSFGSGATWYTVSGPIYGSKAADYASSICTDWPAAFASLGEYMNYCTSPPRKPVAAVKALVTTGGPSYTAMAEKVARHASGSMCGTSNYGLNSWAAVGVKFLSTLVNFGSSADGVVRVMSCGGDRGSGGFGSKASNVWYHPSVNHLDTSCRHGNGWWGSDRKPCDWFANRT